MPHEATQISSLWVRLRPNLAKTCRCPSGHLSTQPLRESPDASTSSSSKLSSISSNKSADRSSWLDGAAKSCVLGTWPCPCPGHAPTADRETESLASRC